MSALAFRGSCRRGHPAFARRFRLGRISEITAHPLIVKDGPLNNIFYMEVRTMRCDLYGQR